MVTIELFKRENDQMAARHRVCPGSSFLEHGSDLCTSQSPERHVPLVSLVLFDTFTVLACAVDVLLSNVLLSKVASFCSEGLTAKVVQLLQGRPDGHPGLCQFLPPRDPSRYRGSFTGLICSPMSSLAQTRPTGGA